MRSNEKSNMIKHYIAIARPDHWFKNVFMLPGIVLAFEYDIDSAFLKLLPKITFAAISICLLSSANYVINEWLDAEFDKYHPKKKDRPSVVQGLKAEWVYTEYLLIALTGLTIAYFISTNYFILSITFLVMGVLYNVRPFRTKDRIYLDVISESINNPLRLFLGWSIVSQMIPPSSILMSYWMGGTFLMGTKRFAEYRFINDFKRAGLYRRSFQFYDERKLLISIVFYALLSSFFLAVFLIKHRIELILSFPFFAILFSWYLNIGFRDNSPVQNPEKLYKETPFIIFLIFLSIIMLILVKIEIPFLQSLI